MNQELDSYIVGRINQGVAIDNIRYELINSGWDAEIVVGAINRNSIHDYKKPRRLKTMRATLIIACLVSAAIIAGVIYGSMRNESPASPTISDETDSRQSNSYVSTDDTQLLQNFCGRTITYSSRWSTSIDSDNAEGSCSVSFFTYDHDEVSNELKQDGRYPRNANFWHDIEDRALESYPFSLDNIYEIQVRFSDSAVGAGSMEELVESRLTNPFTGEKQNVIGLQQYSLPDREVADYVEPGDGSFIAQRQILVYDKALSSGYTLTINRSQSRIEVDQSEIDELDEFISSLTFISDQKRA